MIRATLLALLLAPPAAAQLAPEVAAALDICATAGPDLPTRIQSLVAIGWHAPAGPEIADAAMALAPLNMMKLWLIEEGQSLSDRVAAVQRASTGMLREMERGFETAAFLVTDSGAAIRVTTPTPDLADCVIAADVEAGDVAKQLGLTPEPRNLSLITSTRLIQPGTDDVRAYHDRYASGLFGATDPLAIVTIQPVSITD